MLVRRLNVAEESIAYDYSKHGQEWTQGQCASRIRQSPIDIPQLAMQQVPRAKFLFSYQNISDPIMITNTGQTLSASIRNLGYGGISYAGAWWDIMYINVHAMSEHTLAGVHTPVELHLVHKRYDSDALLIVAIPLACRRPPPAGGAPLPSGAPYVRPPREDLNFNPMLQFFVGVAPPPPMMKQRVPGDIGGYDISLLLAGGIFAGYAGSTTAPPCAENVVWLVRREPIFASDTQLRYLYDAVYRSTSGFGNYRATMPLNGRAIELYYATFEENPTVIAEPLPPAAYAAAQADRGFQAMKWAKDALRVATGSLEYVRDLDQRLHGFGASPTSAPPTAAPCPASPAEQAASAFADVIARAAKEAVANATREISEQAKANAMAVARNATQMVLQLMRANASVAGLWPLVAR